MFKSSLLIWCSWIGMTCLASMTGDLIDYMPHLMLMGLWGGHVIFTVEFSQLSSK